MLDLFDLVAPRVYVVSEKRYEEMLDRRRKEQRTGLEARKESYLKAIAKIDEELEALT